MQIDIVDERKDKAEMACPALIIENMTSPKVKARMQTTVQVVSLVYFEYL